MTSHQVIARKWRPQKFGDVVGQTHVIRTLRNAIAGNRVGHAYLLVGPRGIGKTTIARIFAKAINCENPHDGEPCCECKSCKSLAAESSLDVIEIDAASRNSVEHMRSLSEEAYHMPVSSKYKIYIIDEVHMLSKAAWNALLKTVEEPPAHVKFIFATTEAHLVLPTIVSRCQRFDLRPIAGNLILGRLKMIAESENVKIAPEALNAIARAAEGGMRDAQSSLEQMLAFFGGKDQEIAAEQVLELFGLTNAVELDTLIAAMLQNQPGAVVTIVNQLAGRGRNLETLFDDILEMIRGVEFMHILNNPGAVLEFDDEKLARCGKLAQLTNAQVLRCLMENLSPVGRILHEALNKAIFLESILLKAMHEAHAPTVGDVLARLNQLRSAGDLEFINQVPSFQAQPQTFTMPVVLPEIQPAAPEVKEVKVENPAPAPEPAPEPVKEVPVEEKVAEVAEVAPETPAVEEVAEVIPEVPAVEEVAEVIPEVPAVEEAPAPKPAGDPLQELWQKLLAISGDVKELLLACTPVSLANSVLSVKAPAPVAAAMRENRLKLLTLLQQASGNWAILLDVQSVTASAETPAEAPAVPAAEPMAMPTTAAAEEFVDIAKETVVTESATPPEPMQEGTIVEEGVEEFIELAIPEDPAEAVSELSRADLGYSKRSVIHVQEEVEKTAQLPPVQKVLELFGGEIVDIHA